MKTLQRKYIDALLKLGENQLDDKGKTIKFSCKNGGYYYLGKAGSLRVGKNKSESIPVSKQFKDQLLTKQFS